MRRHKIGTNQARKLFRRNAQKSKRINTTTTMRGGIRL